MILTSKQLMSVKNCDQCISQYVDHFIKYVFLGHFYIHPGGIPMSGTFTGEAVRDIHAQTVDVLMAKALVVILACVCGCLLVMIAIWHTGLR